MKITACATLIAAQMLAAAQPALSAELPSERPIAGARMGTFAGARLRVPLGGAKEKAQAGLAVTSTLRSGAGQLRFSKGAELGFSGDEAAVRLMLGGTPVSQLTQGKPEPQGRKQGVSTLGWIAIGVGAAALIVVAAAAICVSDDDCIPSE